MEWTVQLMPTRLQDTFYFSSTLKSITVKNKKSLQATTQDIKDQC